MTEDERSKKAGEMDLAFRQGKTRGATPEQLQEWLDVLCTGHVSNDMVRHREIIRGLTINHIQMARTIQGLEDTMQRLNAANDRTQQLVVRLTWVAVAVGIIQAIASVISIFR